MVPRFFAPALSPGAVAVDLPPDEALHLIRVLRLGPGDRVRVFDGVGAERAATVLRVTKSKAELSLGEPVTPAPEARALVTLGQALLKADKFDAVVRDATMLGASAVRPLATTRIDVPAAAVREGGRADRWHRVAVASVKQCGRAVVPIVHPCATLAECLASDRSALRVICVEPSAAVPAAAIGSLSAHAGEASALLLVGPEGGWTEEECELARGAGCQPVTLGRRTLRADAAPLVALALLLHALGDL